MACVFFQHKRTYVWQNISKFVKIRKDEKKSMLLLIKTDDSFDVFSSNILPIYV